MRRKPNKKHREPWDRRVPDGGSVMVRVLVPLIATLA